MAKKKFEIQVERVMREIIYIWLFANVLADIVRAVNQRSATPLIGATVYLSIAWGFWYWRRIQLRRLAATTTTVEVSGDS